MVRCQGCIKQRSCDCERHQSACLAWTRGSALDACQAFSPGLSPPDGRRCLLVLAGHTSWITAGMGYLSFWLLGHLRCFHGAAQPLRFLASLLPLAGAAWVGFSRLQDYWHHVEDVAAGFMLGLLMAFCFYRQASGKTSRQRWCVGTGWLGWWVGGWVEPCGAALAAGTGGRRWRQGAGNKGGHHHHECVRHGAAPRPRQPGEQRPPCCVLQAYAGILSPAAGRLAVLVAAAAGPAAGLSSELELQQLVENGNEQV